LGGEERKAMKEIWYLGMVLDSRGKQKKEKKQVVIGGKQL
jgi:hypothetical protein